MSVEIVGKERAKISFC